MKIWKWSTYGVFLIVSILVIYFIDLAYFGRKNDKQKKVCYFLSYLVLIIFAVTRNIEMYPPASTDMQTYIYFFQSKLTDGWNWKKIITFNQWEPLFYQMNIWIRYFTDSYRIYWFILFSIIAFGILYFFVENYDNKIYINFVFLFIINYIYSMVALRSGIAVSICLVAFIFLKKGKINKAVFMILLATLFHYTAIVVLPGILLVRFFEKIKRNKVLWVRILVIICFSMILFMLPILQSLLLNTKYSAYLNFSLTILGQMPIIANAGLSLLFYKRIYDKYESKIYLVNLSIYNLLLVPIAINFGAYRINDFFLIPRLFVWGLILECIKDKFFSKDKRMKKIVTIIGFILALIWLTKIIYGMKEYGIMPYYNEWVYYEKIKSFTNYS